MRETTLKVKLSRIILRHRWSLVSTIALVFIGFEIVEHLIEHHNLFQDPNFWREVLIFGFFSPFLIGTILTLLARTEAERMRVVKQHDLEQELAQELSRAVTWDDLSPCLSSFMQKVAPFSAFALFVFDPQQDRFMVELQWNIPGANANSTKTILPDQCECLESRRWHPLPIDFFPEKLAPDKFKGYCLPLIIGHKPTAMLHLFLPSTTTLSDDQIQILNNVAPSLAFAIDRLHPLGSSIVWATASTAERKRLARHLHDTLGQNLGFLSLKLDMLKGEDVLNEVAAVREELAQMHAIANQAYEQVRATLTTLNKPPAADLAEAIDALAQKVNTQSGLEIRITQQGEKRTFPPAVQQKVINIVGEALANIVKHANASSTSIDLFWGEQLLKISIEDNGQGFNFNGQRSLGHYGLAIMQERAQEINGCLTIQSEIDKGTAVNLEVPFPTS